MKAAWNVCAILFLATALVAQNPVHHQNRRKLKPEATVLTAADVAIAYRDAIAAQQKAAYRRSSSNKASGHFAMNCTAKGQVMCSRRKPPPETPATQADAKLSPRPPSNSRRSTELKKRRDRPEDQHGQHCCRAIQETPEKRFRVSRSAALRKKNHDYSPGGFVAAESIRRSRALASRCEYHLSTRCSTRCPGASAGSNISEFFWVPAKWSRVSMLAEGRAGSAKLSGYVEADFLSAGITSSNKPKATSYHCTFVNGRYGDRPRSSNGFTFTGGQIVESGHRNQKHRRGQP